MNQHSVTKQELIKQLAVDPDMGLTTEEAGKRLSADGENRLKEKKKKSIVVRFLEQFKDAMVIILIIAAIISLVTSIIEHEGLAEPIIIFAIVCLNAVMGVMQESKAEKALEALKNMSSPHARVIRDGREQKIDASQLVRGDIILLEAGDFIPADARLIDCASLKCEEAPLTGESVPVEKDAEAVVNENSPLGDRINMVYSG
ncbi:MAG: HAD-IC family P-type ATPase, partial [Clostridia bacterium]|nr:HAD-IC family P-type ATPase [Clostridia bacterium]